MYLLIEIHIPSARGNTVKLCTDHSLGLEFFVQFASVHPSLAKIGVAVGAWIQKQLATKTYNSKTATKKINIDSPSPIKAAIRSTTTFIFSLTISHPSFIGGIFHPFMQPTR